MSKGNMLRTVGVFTVCLSAYAGSILLLRLADGERLTSKDAWSVAGPGLALALAFAFLFSKGRNEAQSRKERREAILSDYEESAQTTLRRLHRINDRVAGAISVSVFALCFGLAFIDASWRLQHSLHSTDTAQYVIAGASVYALLPTMFFLLSAACLVSGSIERRIAGENAELWVEYRSRVSGNQKQEKQFIAVMFLLSAIGIGLYLNSWARVETDGISIHHTFSVRNAHYQWDSVTRIERSPKCGYTVFFADGYRWTVSHGGRHAKSDDEAMAYVAGRSGKSIANAGK